ncbi:6476_t:CDS:2, partial [Diversispora eburnea]
MGNIKSELDLLKQENTRFLAENTELKNENAKLRQDLEGHEARITKLEWGEKSITNVPQSSVNIISTEMEISNDTPISDITDDISNISANTSNSNDVHEQIVASASDNPKSSEDKEMDDFLDSTYKEKVSKEIIQNIKEKKPQNQEKIITFQDTKSSLSVK